MKIPVHPYQPGWVQRFEAEKDLISRVLQGKISSIEHIGSTSVPGLAAKPIIDILAGVEEEQDLDPVVQPMVEAGFTYFKKYEANLPYRRLLVRLRALTGLPVPALIGPDDEYITGVDFTSDTHVHIITVTSPHYFRHIAFREYLRAHPPVRDAYAELKLALSSKEFGHHLDYNAAKHDFVLKTEAEAVQWYRQQPDARALLSLMEEKKEKNE